MLFFALAPTRPLSEPFLSLRTLYNSKQEPAPAINPVVPQQFVPTRRPLSPPQPPWKSTETLAPSSPQTPAAIYQI